MRSISSLLKKSPNKAYRKRIENSISYIRKASPMGLSLANTVVFICTLYGFSSSAQWDDIICFGNNCSHEFNAQENTVGVAYIANTLIFIKALKNHKINQEKRLIIHYSNTLSFLENYTKTKLRHKHYAL